MILAYTLSKSRVTHYWIKCIWFPAALQCGPLVFAQDSVFCFFVMVVHESLVCPEHLKCLLFFRKILQVPQILRFWGIFVYLNPFQQWLYDFEIHLFTPRTTDGLICNYYMRFKHSLMLQKKKRSMKRIDKTWKLKRWKLLNRMKIFLIFT